LRERIARIEAPHGLRRREFLLEERRVLGELLCDILPWDVAGACGYYQFARADRARPPAAAMSRALLSTSSAEPTGNKAAERAGKHTRACR